MKRHISEFLKTEFANSGRADGTGGRGGKQMKSKDRVKGYREGTADWSAEYNMLLDDGVTCKDCLHVERCCAIFGQRPYINSGRCQFYPNRFKAAQAGEGEQSMNEIEQAIKYLQPIADSATVGHYGDMLGIALAALREQAEREKGCVWCKGNNKIFHDGQHFHMFCSYCGKRLEVGHE